MGAIGRKATIGLGGACALALLVWCVAAVPADMDEFAPVHRLACLYPVAHLNTFAEGCTSYLLDFGIFSYYRSYEYVGAASSILYFPLWSIWRSPFSFYLLGVGTLGLFSFGMAKALRLEARYALIPLGYFPVAYTWMHDTGPIRLAFLSVPAIALLARLAIGDARRSRQMACGALAALVVVVCAEDKAFYLLMAPLIALCVVAIAMSAPAPDAPGTARDAARQGATALVTFLVVAAAGLAMLLFAGHDGGRTYFSLLRGISAGRHNGLAVELKRIFAFTFLPPMFAHRVFVFDSTLAWASALGLIPTTVLVYAFWRHGGLDRRTLAWMGAAYAAGVVVFLVTRSSTEAHHFVFLQLPILVLLMLAASRTPAGWTRVTVYVAASSVLAIATLTMRPVADASARERDRFYTYLSRPGVAATHVVNFSSWGGYYQQALYGADLQLVTFVEPASEPDTGRLMSVAESISRDVIDVCLDCTRSSIAAMFGRSDVEEIDLGLTRWKVFEVRGPWHASPPHER